MAMETFGVFELMLLITVGLIVFFGSCAVLMSQSSSEPMTLRCNTGMKIASVLLALMSIALILSDPIMGKQHMVWVGGIIFAIAFAMALYSSRAPQSSTNQT